jgi:hypothetical protein
MISGSDSWDDYMVRYLNRSFSAMWGTTGKYVETYIPKQVIFNGKTTIVLWQDESKTTVHCSEDEPFSEEIGFAEALAKKVFGSRSAFLKIVENAYRQPEKKVKKKEDNA